jgi:polar amino acid transport system substrate-binding protein
MPAGSFMQRIKARGYLVVGVEDNAPGFGYRAPNGAMSGFEVDLAREVARAIFGDPNKIVFRVLSSAQRIPAVADGEVDIVASLLSITCQRWQQVDFTTPYYHAYQTVLVFPNSNIRSIHDLNGKRVCVTLGSTASANLARMAPEAQIVAVAERTDCVAALEHGTVDAIANDDTILAGFGTQLIHDAVGPSDAAWEQVPQLLPFPQLEPESYGMAIATNHPEFVRFVNAVLDQLRTSGRWSQLRDNDMRAALQLSPQTPPLPEYGP